MSVNSTVQVIGQILWKTNYQSLFKKLKTQNNPIFTKKNWIVLEILLTKKTPGISGFTGEPNVIG